ncbi:MAG: hypothetical protein GX270_11035 [Clostridiaceae bacterium]|nr:hypothetical protein [Clostridiaceae bacterium]
MIRIIAMLTMLLDHVGQVFFPNLIIFPIVGRLALPLFAWGIVNGYKKTKNFKMYALRILILAIVSQYPYMLLFKNEYFNICFTLLTGLIILKVYDLKLNGFLKAFIILFLGLIAHEFDFEYGIYGIALLLIFHIFDRKYYYLVPLQIAVTFLGMKLYRFESLQLISIVSIGVIVLFEKYNFRINKIINYGFYPGHILILLAILNLIR